MAANRKLPPETMAPEQSRAARAWLGWSQDQLASAAHVSVASVRNFESGQRVLHPNTIASMRQAIASAGIDLLFDAKGEPTGINRRDTVGRASRSRRRSSPQPR